MVHIGYVIEAAVMDSTSLFLLLLVLSRLVSYYRRAKSGQLAWKRLMLAYGITFTLLLQIIRSVDAWSVFKIYAPIVTHMFQSQITCLMVYCLALVVSYNIDVLCSTMKHHTPKRYNQLLGASVIILHGIVTACVTAEVAIDHDEDETPDGDVDTPPRELYDLLLIRSVAVICIASFVCASLAVVYFKLRTAVRKTVHHLRELEQRDLAAVGEAAKQDMTWAHRSTLLLATDPGMGANGSPTTGIVESSSGISIPSVYLQSPRTSTSIMRYVSSLANTRRRIDLLESAVQRLCIVTWCAVIVTAGALFVCSIVIRFYVTKSLTVEEYLHPDSSNYSAPRPVMSSSQLVALAVLVWYVWPRSYWEPQASRTISSAITKVKPQSPLMPPAKVEEHRKAADAAATPAPPPSAHEIETKETIPPELFALHDYVPHTFHAAAEAQPSEEKAGVDAVNINVRSNDESSDTSVELSITYHPSRTLPHPPYNSRVQDAVQLSSVEGIEQALLYIPPHLTSMNASQCAT